MIWLRLSMMCRPLWQLSILLLYSFGVTTWQQASLAILGAVYIVSNALLAMLVDHERWQTVRRWALLTEAGATVLASTFMVWHWPLGPVSLLLLPTLVAYAWLFPRDGWQWAILSAVVCTYIVSVRWAVAQAEPANLAVAATVLPELVLALYGAVILFGAMLAFLLQLQRAESERLYVAMQRVEEQSKQLARVNEQMNLYAEKIYELATAEERNRIAGEIHDTVAHRLTALLVQLQAARRIMASEGDAVAAVNNLEVCEALARESLDEVRYSVRAIRRDSGNEGTELLRRLTVHYASLTGMEIEFHIDPRVSPLPAQVVAVLYRAMQEALTNAQRHGCAEHRQAQGFRALDGCPAHRLHLSVRRLAQHEQPSASPGSRGGPRSLATVAGPCP
jgi:signal transduction histidine kinase